jgi:hypothetical protein
MRLKTYLLLSLVTVVLAIAVRQTYAIWVEIQLTPQSADGQRLLFTVKTKDVDDLKRFEVAIKPKTGKLSPVLTARLHLVDGQIKIASVPVEETRADGKVTYWFLVAPSLLANSKFEFGEHGYGRCEDEHGKVITDDWGRPRYVGVPGGSGYWFYLRDFAESTETTKVSRNVKNFRGVFKLNSAIPVNLDCPKVKDIWDKNQKPFKIETVEFTERDKHLHCLLKITGQTAAEGKFMVRVKIYSGESHDLPGEAIVALRGFLFETTCVVPTIPLLISEQQNLEFGPVYKFSDATRFEVEIEDVKQ